MTAADASAPNLAAPRVRSTRRGAAGIAEYAPDRVTIEVNATAPAVLVLTDTWSPEWVADVDGAAATVHRVDLAFRGVVVAAGDHRVTFRHVPAATYLGFALALVTLALTSVGALLLSRRLGRGGEQLARGHGSDERWDADASQRGLESALESRAAGAWRAGAARDGAAGRGVSPPGPDPS